MNFYNRLVFVLVGLVAFAGCIPRKRIVWSPDGSRAAVLTDRGLFFIDPQGRVLPPRLAGIVSGCDWFEDGRRLVVARTAKAKTWNELAAGLEKDQVARIKRLAEKIRPRLLAYEGDWDDFELDEEKRLPTGEEVAAILYLRDARSEGLSEKLGEKWNELEKIEGEVSHVQLFTTEADALVAGRKLFGTVSGINRPLVSPGGRHVAFLGARGEDAAALYVVAAGGGAPRLVAENVASDYAWGPDGRRLAFIHCSASRVEGGDSLQLGALTTVTIANDQGRLLEKWIEREDRVGLVFNPTMAVKWLRDGRLLFSSLELNLPTTTRDMPQQWSLFVLDPRMPATVHRVLARDFGEALDLSVLLFEVSPDETKVLLPGPNGRVTIYAFASGEATPLIKTDVTDRKTRMLPSWRNNAEVCFVMPAKKPGPISPDAASRPSEAATPAEVAIWADGQVRVISKDWPEEMKEGWLTGD